MSLLLDALKKSEAQRRRGKAPAIDLASTPPSSGRRRPGMRWLLALLVGVVLVAAAPWLWPQISNLIEKRQVAGMETGELARSDAGRQAAVEASGRSDENSSIAGDSDQVTDSTEAAQSPRRADPAPVAGAASTRLAASTDATADSGQLGSDSPTALPAEERVDERAAGEGGGEGGSATAPVPETQQISERRPAGQARESRPETGAEPEPEPEPEPELRENFIRPWELPQAQRSEFPDLDLTVHFFSDRPENRFVLINGERYTEGQGVGPDTRLVEIRRRGAVVEFGSYRVLIE